MNIRFAPVSEAPFDLLTLADPSRDRIRQHLNNGRLLLGCEPGSNDAIAAAILNEHGEDLEISNIAVALPYQGRRVGKQMVAFIVEFSHQQGYRQVQVGTGNSSLEQLAFYQKCGFRMAAVITDYFIEDDPPIFENGIRCLDMILLTYPLISEP